MFQYYFQHNRAPPIVNELDAIDLNEIKLLRDYPKDVLPYVWDDYLHSQNVSKINLTSAAVACFSSFLNRLSVLRTFLFVTQKT